MKGEEKNEQNENIAMVDDKWLELAKICGKPTLNIPSKYILSSVAIKYVMIFCTWNFKHGFY